MERERLQQLVMEFSTIVSDNLKFASDNEPLEVSKTATEVYSIWLASINGMLSPMFLGYAMGEGEDIDFIGQPDIVLALHSLIELNDVEFDWLGELDAKSIPH